jgi:hypothetical protein
VDELAGDSDYQSVEDAHTGSEVERLSMANDERNGRLPKGISSIHDSDMPRGGKRPHGSRHTRWCSSACSRDHSAPSDGGVMHPEVSRYLDMAAAKMGNAERPHGSNVRHAPMSAAELHRARAAARPGHT